MAEVSPGVWTHHTPVRLIAGPNALERLPALLPDEGPILLVTTPGFSRRGLTDRVRGIAGRVGVVVYDRVTPNAELDQLETATAELRRADVRAIVGLGGGSTLDTAKALAVTLCSELARPLEAVFRRSEPQAWAKSLRLIAVPTTSGTGSEVTPFATVWDRTTHRKNSLSGDVLYPYAAVLDPELTISLPAEETLYSALDAISHALESLWNKNKTPLSELHAVRALSLAADALPRVLEKAEDVRARAAMQQASLLSGLAISQTRTAVAHSVSYPLTARFGVPHGLACSFTLPALLRSNCDRMSLDSAGVAVLRRVLRLLESLQLGERLRRYVAAPDVYALQDEMLAKGRIDNFDGRLDGDLASLLRESIF